MAIYHLGIKRIGRSSGQSAVASAAYYSGQMLADRRTGIRHRMPERSGLIHEVLLMPSGVEFGGSREDLWNAVEAAEKRRDANTALLCDVALPDELDNAQNRVLADSFGKFLANFFVSAVDLTVRQHDGRNIVAIYMVSAREVTNSGFKRKNRFGLCGADRRKRSLPSSPMHDLREIREMWGSYCNAVLATAGHQVRIDHRSFQERGIDLVPQTHMGPAANRRLKRGEAIDRTPLSKDVSHYNAVTILNDEGIVRSIMRDEGLPTPLQTVARTLRRYINDDDVVRWIASNLARTEAEG